MPRDNNNNYNFSAQIVNKFDLFHHNEVMLSDFEAFKDIAADTCVAPILLYGESQSGKSHIARNIVSECPSCSDVEVFYPAKFSTLPDDAFRRLGYILNKQEEEFRVIVIDDLDIIISESNQPEETAARFVALFKNFFGTNRLVICTATNGRILEECELLGVFSFCHGLKNEICHGSPHRLAHINSCIKFYLDCNSSEAAQICELVENRVVNYGQLKTILFASSRTHQHMTGKKTFGHYLEVVKTLLERTKRPITKSK
jgi:hypothetical protein